MDDIAREAQFSKATLYQYFNGKSEIFFAIISSLLEEIMERLEEIKEKNFQNNIKQGGETF